MMKLKRIAGAQTALLLLPGLLPAATIYSIVDLGALPGGSATSAASVSSNGYVTGSGDTASAFSQPFLWSTVLGISAVDTDSGYAFGTGVNASGTVVGYKFSDDFSNFTAFANDGSGPTQIPTLGGANNAATGINDAGTVVGYSEDGSGTELAYVYDPTTGIATPLGVLPGGSTSSANAINGTGLIVGEADVGGLSHAVVLSGGAWIDLGVPSGSFGADSRTYQSSTATAVSNAGQIAGTLSGDDGSMAVLWQSDSSVVALGALTAGGTSSAYSVNSSGEVVGTSDGVAFLFNGVGMHDLNSLLSSTSSGWQLTEGDAINDQGQIAGTGLIDGQQHAFLLTPDQSTPEPATLPLVCGAVLLFAARCRHSFRKVKS